jgi:hypothetical protein
MSPSHPHPVIAWVVGSFKASKLQQNLIVGCPGRPLEIPPGQPPVAVLAVAPGILIEQEQPARHQDASHIPQHGPLGRLAAVVERQPDPDHISRFRPMAKRVRIVRHFEAHRTGQAPQIDLRGGQRLRG